MKSWVYREWQRERRWTQVRRAGWLLLCGCAVALTATIIVVLLGDP